LPFFSNRDPELRVGHVAGGSVRKIRYSVDPLVFRPACGRNEGGIFGADDL